jgi:hypothetical protein
MQWECVRCVSRDAVRHAEQLEPCTQTQAGLAAANDQHVRLVGFPAERMRKARSTPLVPVPSRRPWLRNFVNGRARMAEGATAAGGKGSALKLPEARSERRRLAVRVKPYVGSAAPCYRVEAQPTLSRPVW